MKTIFKFFFIAILLAFGAVTRKHKLLRKAKGDRIKTIIEKAHRKDGITINDSLGENDLGAVFEVEDNATGKKSAIKTMFFKHKEHRSIAIEEINIMKKVKDLPAMLPICGYKFIKSRKHRGISIFLPRAINDLEHYLYLNYKNKLTFTPEEKFRLFSSLLIGLQAMHKIGLIHRDIKPSNLLVMENKNFDLLETSTLVYADFGITINEKDKYEKDLSGTPIFIAPDFDEAGNYVTDKLNDIYALGLTFACIDYPQLYVALTSKKPNHETEDIWTLAHKLSKLKGNKLKQIKKIRNIIDQETEPRSDLDKFLFELIYDDMLVSLEKRLTADELVLALQNQNEKEFNKVEEILDNQDYCSVGLRRTEIGDKADEGETTVNRVKDSKINTNDLKQINSGSSNTSERELSVEEKDLDDVAQMLESAGIHEEENIEHFDFDMDESVPEEKPSHRDISQLGGIRINESKLKK